VVLAVGDDELCAVAVILTEELDGTVILELLAYDIVDEGEVSGVSRTNLLEETPGDSYEGPRV